MLLAKDTPQEILEGTSMATALVVDDSDTEDAISSNVQPVKKAKITGKRSLATLDGFVDRPMAKEEKELTDLMLLRCVLTFGRCQL